MYLFNSDVRVKFLLITLFSVLLSCQKEGKGKFSDGNANLKASLVDARSLSIRGGASTSNSHVDLELNAQFADQMYISDGKDCEQSDDKKWLPYAPEFLNWELKDKNQEAFVSVMFKNKDGINSKCLSNSILHDDIAPIALSLKMGDSESTNSELIDLKISAIDADYMMLTEDKECELGQWVPFATDLSDWPLSQHNRINTLYVKFKDKLGNISECINSSILHDNIAPTNNEIKLGSSSYTNKDSETVIVSPLDADEMYVTGTLGCLDGGQWQTVEPVIHNWSLSQYNTETSVYVKFRDGVGNESECYHDSIVHDNIAPAKVTSITVLHDHATDMLKISWIADELDINHSHYEISLGSEGGQDDIYPWVKTSSPDSYNISSTELKSGSILYANIRAVDQAGNTSEASSSSAYLFKGFVQESYIKASNNLASGYFGSAVAIYEDTLVVSALGNELLGDECSVYVFERQNGLWAQKSCLKPDSVEQGDHFGSALAIYKDTIVISAPGDDSSLPEVSIGPSIVSDNNVSNSGGVYVFKRQENEWTQQAFLKAPNNSKDLIFGRSVAIHANMIAVGSSSESNANTSLDEDLDPSKSASGAVYVFEQKDHIWSYQSYLKVSKPKAGTFFGWSLDLHNDTLVVGAVRDPSEQNFVTNGIESDNEDSTYGKAGAAHVFRYDGSKWYQEAYLKPSNIHKNSHFGGTVSVFGDYIAVGAFGDNALTSELFIGATYLFKRIDGIWSQQAILHTPNKDGEDAFGVSVSLKDGYLAVAAFGDDSSKQSVINDISQLTDMDDDTEGSGAVYIYQLEGEQWHFRSYLKASNSGELDRMGHYGTINHWGTQTVAISNGTVVAAVPLEDNNHNGIEHSKPSTDNDEAEDSGAVFTFRMD